MSNMNAILQKQDELLEKNKNDLQQVLTDGQKNMQENNSKTIEKLTELGESNQTTLSSMNEEMNKNMNRIENDTKSVVNEAKQESKDLVSKAKKGAMVAYWGDAFKYGLATTVIAVPVILVVQWLVF